MSVGKDRWRLILKPGVRSHNSSERERFCLPVPFLDYWYSFTLEIEIVDVDILSFDPG